ncbi:MAG: hypothetical protein GY780_06005 [bacterium]|nr:hypothetical protein [bacterium]
MKHLKTAMETILLISIFTTCLMGCSDDNPAAPGDDGDDYTAPELASTYAIVDTDQSICYDNNQEIVYPADGENYYGQDAQVDGYQPSYVVSTVEMINRAGEVTWEYFGISPQDKFPKYSDMG